MIYSFASTNVLTFVLFAAVIIFIVVLDNDTMNGKFRISHGVLVVVTVIIQSLRTVRSSPVDSLNMNKPVSYELPRQKNTEWAPQTILNNRS